jgi:ABC-type uncharacterized transport system involved in gliding motility auxiliary subunit
MNQKKELNKRQLSFGANSIFITLVVLALIGVLNFLSARYPQKLDLTKNKIHTFSDQSSKVMAGLKGDLTATFYGDLAAKEKFRPIFDSYKRLSPKFKFELVDPNKEPTRAKQAGIKKMETLILGYEGRTTKVEDITEEKITNEIIKLSKGTRLEICSIVGHGEQSFSAIVADGLSAAKKGLEDQSYEVKELTLPQETKIPADCTAVVMLGATKALFPAEIKMLGDYLDNGGRLIVGVEASITQTDDTKELKDLLKSWGVDVKGGLVIDPVSRMLGVDASVPIIAQFNSDHPITKEFKQQCYFPFTRPVDSLLTPPEGLKTTWLAKTTAKAWGEMDMKSIAKGEVQYNPGIDLAGPINVAVAVSGKKKESKATRETRIVVFGSSQFANNNYARFGSNQDLFLNSVSWAVEDESLISIRAKEEDVGKIELSQTQGLSIFWVTVIVVPLIISIMGIVIWVRRKKL